VRERGSTFAVVRTVAIAGLVAAAIVAAGWGLQSVGLPQAARGNEAAVRAAVWLMRFRLTSSSVRIGGRVLRARCYHGWFDGRNGRDQRGTLLEFDNELAVRDLSPHPRATALRALELAGCTDVLGPRVASYAIANTVLLRRTQVSDRPALAIRMHRLTVFVAPRTDRPLGVQLAGTRSTIRLTHMTPSLARRLEAGS
jgi:hypothetical protein